MVNARSGGNVILRTFAGGISLQTSVTERVIIQSDGDVGMGTLAPGAKLHVQDASFAGRFQATGTFAGVTIGVEGVSHSMSGVGVKGVGPGNNGYGVFAVGNLGADGTKSFRIDHPDDPANKYLLHYCAESPEVINFYSGKATLDGAGEAMEQEKPEHEQSKYQYPEL